MTNPKLEDIIQAAELHYKNSLSDIENASTRIEHLRLSALAEEAGSLLQLLNNFALAESHRIAAAPLPGTFGTTH